MNIFFVALFLDWCNLLFAASLSSGFSIASSWGSQPGQAWHMDGTPCGGMRALREWVNQSVVKDGEFFGGWHGEIGWKEIGKKIMKRKVGAKIGDSSRMSVVWLEVQLRHFSDGQKADDVAAAWQHLTAGAPFMVNNGPFQ